MAAGYIYSYLEGIEQTLSSKATYKNYLVNRYRTNFCKDKHWQYSLLYY